MIAALAIIGGGIMLLAMAHWFAEALKSSAAFEERLKQVQKQLDADKRQAEEMLKERTVEDVVRDLDAGEF